MYIYVRSSYNSLLVHARGTDIKIRDKNFSHTNITSTRDLNNNNNK